MTRRKKTKSGPEEKGVKQGEKRDLSKDKKYMW